MLLQSNICSRLFFKLAASFLAAPLTLFHTHVHLSDAVARAIVLLSASLLLHEIICINEASELEQVSEQLDLA